MFSNVMGVYVFYLNLFFVGSLEELSKSKTVKASLPSDNHSCRMSHPANITFCHCLNTNIRVSHKEDENQEREI